jgi:hypothetical protein
MTGMGMDLEGSSHGLFEVLSWHLPEVTVENHEILMIVGAPAKIRTEYLPNTNLQRYFLINLFGYSWLI